MKRFMYAAVLAGLLGAEIVQAQRAVPDPYANIGNGGDGWNKLACRGTFAWRCAGWIGSTLSTDISENDEDLVERLSKARWEVPSVPTRRKPKDILPLELWPVHTIQSMPNPNKIKLSSMSKHGLVVARIIADPTGAVDSRYGIGGMVSTPEVKLSSTFYLVVNNYSLDGLAKVDSRPVATWTIYTVQGVEGKRRLVKVGNSGRLQWCQHRHMQQQADRAAQFLTCSAYAELDSLRHDTSLMQFATPSSRPMQSSPDRNAPLLPLDRVIHFVKSASTAGLAKDQIERIERVRKLLTFDENPAWVTCGVGCCTADI